MRVCMCVHVVVCKGDCWKQNICLRIKRISLSRLQVVVYSLSCVQLFATPWTVAHQAPLSRRFPRPEYWSGLPFPTPEVVTWRVLPKWGNILRIIRKREVWSDMKEVDACSGILVGGELRKCMVDPEVSWSECKQFCRAESGVRFTHTGLVKNSFGFFYNILQENLNEFLANQ